MQMSLFFIVAPPNTYPFGWNDDFGAALLPGRGLRKVKKVLRFGYNITATSQKKQDPNAKKFQKISFW
jgi:hypothetical protein